MYRFDASQLNTVHISLRLRCDLNESVLSKLWLDLLIELDSSSPRESKYDKFVEKRLLFIRTESSITIPR